MIRPGQCAQVTALTITVPGPGTVQVRSLVWLTLFSGQADTVRLNIETANPVQCPNAWGVTVDEFPNDGNGAERTLPVERIFTVGAGTHTYRLGARDTSTTGQGLATHGGWISAVFYPD